MTRKINEFRSTKIQIMVDFKDKKKKYIHTNFGWVVENVNMLMGVKIKVAFDGELWFVKTNYRKRFKEVNEESIPEDIQKRMQKHIKKLERRKAKEIAGEEE